MTLVPTWTVDKDSPGQIFQFLQQEAKTVVTCFCFDYFDTAERQLCNLKILKNHRNYNKILLFCCLRLHSRMLYFCFASQNTAYAGEL
ncbi:hypothetical protein VU07_03150 [Desulfobulbus sp. F4]|nr:hypothetical protein [Desulfobulbus sp. F4]